jgi:hypothetical protein
MHDDKHLNWNDSISDDGAADIADDHDDARSVHAARADVFRNWLSRAPAPSRRASFDASIYTWKGYRRWQEEVRRSWSDRDE